MAVGIVEMLQGNEKAKSAASRMALTDSNGLVVERYEYDPYGRTEVLTVTYMHDANLDGKIDASDEAHLNACLATEEMQRHPMCVFVHDIDGDGIVDLDDLSVFQGFDYSSNGPRPPAEWERAPTSLYDANNDKHVGMFDFYGFQVCFASTNSLCHYVYDANSDSQVTLADYTTFLASYQRTAPTRTATNGASRFGNPFMWTGQRYDAAVGLYHFLFRSYSPELGRWLQRDPLGYVDGMTLYQYVRGLPTASTDPLGLNDPAWTRQIGAPSPPPTPRRDRRGMRPRPLTALEWRQITFALEVIKTALPGLPRDATILIGSPTDGRGNQVDGVTVFSGRSLQRATVIVHFELFVGLRDPAAASASSLDDSILAVGLGIVNLSATLAHELWHVDLFHSN